MMTDYTFEQDTQRPGSIRSVASNSSISSGVSLTRRARTRTRSRTLTSPRPPDSLPKDPASTSNYIEGEILKEPILSRQNSQDRNLGLPPLPARSPLRSAPGTVQGGSLVKRQNSDISPANDWVEEPETYQKSPNLLRQNSGMQVHPTVAQPHPPPSAFSRDPELTGVNPSASVRDSLSTQLSGLSSSIYPPSTSTADSVPYPHSMNEQEDDFSSYDPEVAETQEYDGDDVSYRLRLLVNNSYFLPPTHSKPSPADFAASETSATKKAAKPQTPTFFDLFRGKSKSKPSTPTGSSTGYDLTGPAVRTAADSITTAHLLRPRSSSQIPRNPPAVGRVVVVREKMQDLAAAAKQAEQDMKARGVRRDHDAQVGQQVFSPVIDPTDAVDLPPPSSNYPFAVQASALHGLGVQESVGAALLADRLPPPQSPGMSSSFDQDESWRKALLHQAVHYSLDSSSPEVSFSTRLSPSSPLVETSQSPSSEASPIKSIRLEQRIISNLVLSDDSSSPALVQKNSYKSMASTSTTRERAGRRPWSLDTSQPAGVPPLRSATPSGPLTPLMPAPRKHFTHPTHSPSPSEPPRSSHYDQTLAEGDSRRLSVRRTVSSPRLSELSGSDTRRMVITPPLPTPTLSTASFSELQDSRTTSQLEQGAADDYGVPRRSIATSTLDGRPSLSEYSQPSPTMSAFRNAPATGDELSSHWRLSVDREGLARESPVPRYTATSPPPRMSSSLAHFALSPPPRSSSFNYQTQQFRVTSTPSVPEPSPLSQSPQPSHPLTPPIDDPTLIIDVPEPITPPLPIAERRGNPPGRQLSLNIPSTRIPIAIHSAPGPVSPTSFFDTIQTHPNAMDDLESSSDESDEEVTQLNPPNSFRPDPRGRSLSVTPSNPRPSFMRLGNHSTPYVSQAVENRHHRLDVKNKLPVGNIPIRTPFFTKRAGKSDQGHDMPVSSFEFYKYTQKSQEDAATIGDELSNLASSKRRSVGSVATWQSDSKAQESLKRLDGMLIQHMEAEKDTIKRIATTARSNIPVTRGY